MKGTEAFELLRMEATYTLSLGELSITILTGYLLIAFFIGARLTRFQVIFATAVYSVMYLSTAVSLSQSQAVLVYLTNSMQGSGSEIPVVSSANPSLSYLVTGLLYLGSIYFMWSVRHPKGESPL
jgi:small-conductance mechanosensitive channel